MNTTLAIPILPAFLQFEQPGTHKAAYGGRASGKSQWAAARCVMLGTMAAHERETEDFWGFDAAPFVTFCISHLSSLSTRKDP